MGRLIKMNSYYCTLGEMDISVNELMKEYQAPFDGEDSEQVSLFVDFYNTYLKTIYDDCIFFEDGDDFDITGKPSWKLYEWYKKHINAMTDIKSWYEANRDEIISNELTVKSSTKTSDTPQDGTDYTDTYPTTQVNVENNTQMKDNVSFLNNLAKKYHDYMDDFKTLFIKENGLYWRVQ